MKLCLYCGKEFKEKKDTAKFCSVSHRVMWNRKNKSKPKGLSAEQKMNIVYNNVLKLLSSAALIPVPNSPTLAGDAHPSFTSKKEEPKKILIKRTYANYQELRLDCSTAEEWQELKNEIINADSLSKQEKISLTI